MSTRKSVLNNLECKIINFIIKFGIVEFNHIIKYLHLKSNNKILISEEEYVLYYKKYYKTIKKMIRLNLLKMYEIIEHVDNNKQVSRFVTLHKCFNKQNIQIASDDNNNYTSNLTYVNIKTNYTPYKTKNLILKTLTHDMLLIDLYCQFKINYSNFYIFSELELRQEKYLINIVDKTKVPDLLLKNDQQIIAIELELNSKDYYTTVEILMNYIYNPDISEVWYFVKSINLANKLNNIIVYKSKIRFFLLELNLNKSMIYKYNNKNIINYNELFIQKSKI